MEDIDVLRYVVSHMERYGPPAIRKSLMEKGVTLDRVEAALSEARRLEKESRETGRPIDLGEPERPTPLSTKIFMALAAAAAVVAAGKWLMSHR